MSRSLKPNMLLFLTPPSFCAAPSTGRGVATILFLAERKQISSSNLGTAHFDARTLCSKGPCPCLAGFNALWSGRRWVLQPVILLMISSHIHLCTQGLTFVNGAFRHRWTLQNPSPPPLPYPPPGMNYGPAPPHPSPPPISPPPYYSGSKIALNQTGVQL